MKHAWLIIAHNEFGILQRLISMLDDERSDFYIHIDKKVKQLPELHVEKGQLQILHERIDVRWGSVSQIETELLLLETALAGGPYAHYHILSGTHLPLKSLSELMAFYDSHADEEVMRCWAPDAGDADFKLRRYHFPVRSFKYGSPLRRRLCRLCWQTVLKVQKMFGIRHLRGQAFRKTDNWMSLTEAGARFLAEHKATILKKYRWSFCGDEYFAATELIDGGFKTFDCPQLLHVEFQGDTPKTYTLDALPALQQTGCLWARKFTGKHAD